MYTASNYNNCELTTCGHVKTFSPVIVSTEGSSNAHCLANGTMADTAKRKQYLKCDKIHILFYFNQLFGAYKEYDYLIQLLIGSC